MSVGRECSTALLGRAHSFLLAWKSSGSHSIMLVESNVCEVFRIEWNIYTFIVLQLGLVKYSTMP